MDAKRIIVIIFSLLLIMSNFGCSSDKGISSNGSKVTVVTEKKIPIDDAPTKEIGMLTSAKDAMVELDKKVKPDAAKFIVDIIEEKLQYGKIKKVTFAGLPYFDYLPGSHAYGMQESRAILGGKRRGVQYTPDQINTRNDGSSVFLIETEKYQDLLVEIKKDYSWGKVYYYGKNLYSEKGIIFKDVSKADISKNYISRNERRKIYEKSVADAKNKFTNFNISDCLDYELSLYPNVERVGSNIVVTFATYPKQIQVSKYDKAVVWDAFLLVYDSSGNLLEAKQIAGSGKNSSSEDKQTNNNNTKSEAAMDKTYLGKWSGLKPGSQNTKTPNTITITKSNSQTGGYEVELFFYRIANAKGYANIDGNKLSINQGDIMGQKFRGSIEKTNNGIRLTVTESGFQYVKPGSVYEYIK